MEGIAKQKPKASEIGKAKKMEDIIKLKNEGLGAIAIAKRMNIHRDSVYRLLKK